VGQPPLDLDPPVIVSRWLCQSRFTTMQHTSRVIAACQQSSPVEFFLRVRSLLKTRHEALDVVETVV